MRTFRKHRNRSLIWCKFGLDSALRSCAMGAWISPISEPWSWTRLLQHSHIPTGAVVEQRSRQLCEPLTTQNRGFPKPRPLIKFCPSILIYLPYLVLYDCWLTCKFQLYTMFYSLDMQACTFIWGLGPEWVLAIKMYGKTEIFSVQISETKQAIQLKFST